MQNATHSATQMKKGYKPKPVTPSEAFIPKAKTLNSYVLKMIEKGHLDLVELKTIYLIILHMIPKHEFLWMRV
jgi:hypothetical protein